MHNSTTPHDGHTTDIDQHDVLEPSHQRPQHPRPMTGRDGWCAPGGANGGRRTSRFIRRHQLSWFMALAFLLSWAAWPLVALNPTSSPLVPFGPLLAAVAITAVSSGRDGLRLLLGQLLRWRRATRWYLLAAGMPLAVTMAAAALATAVGGASASTTAEDWRVVLATFVSTVVLAGLFEELGWRGYLLPHLLYRLDWLRSAFIIGVFWALWHLPELLSDPTQQRPPLPFLIGVLAQSVVLAWLYIRTRGSLPLVILSHATTNTAAQFILPAFTGPNYELIWWFSTGLWVATAVLVVTVAPLRPRPSPRLGAARAAWFYPINPRTGRELS